MKKTKKHLILLLVAALVLTLLPMSVFAEWGDQATADTAVQQEPAEAVQDGADLPPTEPEQAEEPPETEGAQANTGVAAETEPAKKADAGDAKEPEKTTLSTSVLPASEEADAQIFSGEIMPTALYSGDCGASGNNLQWSLDTVTGVLTITGTGAMANYSGSSTPWNSYKSDIQTVLLPDGITTIGDHAFNGCGNLVNVNFPLSLISIGSEAFFSTKITTLDLSNHTSLASLGSYTFRYCALTSVKLPDQLTTIGALTFANCASLTEIKLPENLQSIGNDAFAYAPITVIEFPASLTNLGGNSFRDTKLKTVIFNGMTAPTEAGAFNNIPGGGTLYYPVGATGYVKGTFGAPKFNNWTFLAGMPGAVLTAGTSTRSSDSDATVSFTSTKAGTYYYLAQNAGEPAPTADKVVADGISGGNCAANTLATVNISSLVRGAQDVYIVVDTPGSVYSNVLKVSLAKWNPNGNCGMPTATDMQWELDRESGVLTITGSGAMRDFFRNTINDRPWAAYVNDIQSVSLPSGTTTVGNSAFYGCANLATVNFPLTLTSIGIEAFCGAKIATLDLSNHTALLSIGNNAFENCSALTNVKLPDQLTTIAANIFRGCGSLTDVQLPQNTDTIGDNAFYGCGNLANINFPLSLTSIGSSAFYQTKITTLDLSNHTSLSSIGSYAFRYCGSLTTIKLPDQLTTIEQYTFSNCSALTELKLPANLVTIKNNAFGYLPITKVEFPATLTTLEGTSFRTTNLNTIVFNGMTAPTEVRPFGDVPNHGTLYYPAGATGYVKGTFGTPDLDSWTFYDMNAPVLTENTVARTSDSNATVAFTSTKAGTYYYLAQDAGDPAPAANTIISTGTSGSCGAASTSANITSLARGAQDVYFVVETPGNVLRSAVLKVEVPKWNPNGTCGSPTAADITWEFDRESGVLSFTGSGDMEDFLDAGAPWYDYRNDIQSVNMDNAITRIGDFAFIDCTVLDDMNFPTALESIGECAFSYCTALEDVDLSACISLDSIGAQAFGNSALKQIDLSNNTALESIEEFMFWQCSALTDVVLPSSLESIGSNAFAGCSTLSNINFPSALTEIGSFAFQECAALQDADLSGSTLLTTISENTFEDCTALESVALPTSLLTIEDNAFLNCAVLDTLNIESCTLLESIGDNAFMGCAALEAVDLSDATSLLSIGDCAFRDCIALESAALPASLTNLGEMAFENCEALLSMDLSDCTALTTINENTFADCDVLTRVDLPASLTTIADAAFAFCPNLELLVFDASNAPALGNQVFDGVVAVGDLYYPAGANGYVAGTFGTPDLDSWNFRATPSTLTADAIERTSETDASFSFVGSEDAEYYYAVVPYGDPVPTLDTTVAGVSLTKDTAENIPLTGLAQSTAYEVYIAAKDGLGNVSNILRLEIPVFEYTLTVTNGTGSGSYAGGMMVNIEANPAPAGKIFSHWVSSSANVTFVDESNSSTSFAMPFEDITVTAEYEDAHTQRTLTHTPTGISVTGWFTKDAMLTVSSDITCAELLGKQKDGKLLLLHEVSSAGHRGDEVTVSIPVGNEYNGKTLTILHGLEDGSVESQSAVVRDGKVTATFSGLSPYAVEKPADSTTPTNPDANKTNTTGSTSTKAETTGSAKTGDDSNLMLWVLLLVAACSVISVLFWKKAQWKKQR